MSSRYSTFTSHIFSLDKLQLSIAIISQLHLGKYSKNRNNMIKTLKKHDLDIVDELIVLAKMS